MSDRIEVTTWENAGPAASSFGRYGACVGVLDEMGRCIIMAETRSEISELDAVAHAISEACNAIRNAPRRKIQ